MSILKKGILHRVATDGGSASGTGAGILGEVNTFSDLPASATIGNRYLVLTYSISTPTKLKGVYRWNGSSWDRQNGARAFDVVYDNSGSTLTSVNLEASTNELDSKVNGKEPSFTKNTAFNKNFGTVSGTVAEGNDSRFTNHLNSFTQNLGQYIATEGIRARDNAGVAILNDAGLEGIIVADSGDVDITTKMASKEIRARDVNGLKLHDDNGSGLIVKDGGDVEVTTKILSSEVKAKDANGLKLHDDGGNGLTVHDGGNISHNTTLNAASFSIDGNTSADGTFAIRSLKTNATEISHIHYGTNADWYIRSGNLSGKVILQDEGGYCGVGTSNPGVKLEVSSQDSCTLAVNKNSEYAANGVAARFQNESGGHSWGVVAEFRVNGTAGSDRPSILFSHGYNNTTWSLGIAGSDDNFRIRQNHGYRNSSWGTVRFYIATNGDVGIGTENPGAKLHVAGNVRASRFIDNQNTNRYIDPAGGSQLGDLTVNGNLTVSGSVSKNGGSFDIPHPHPDKKDTHRLRHYFVETPSAGGNIYKYQLECKRGDNYIDLPDYFQFLNKDSLVWVNPFKHFGRAWGEVKNDKKIKIVAEQEGIYNILVFGDRKDEAAMKNFNEYGIEYKIKK